MKPETGQANLAENIVCALVSALIALVPSAATTFAAVCEATVGDVSSRMVALSGKADPLEKIAKDLTFTTEKLMETSVPV